MQADPDSSLMAMKRPSRLIWFAIVLLLMGALMAASAGVAIAGISNPLWYAVAFVGAVVMFLRSLRGRHGLDRGAGTRAAQESNGQGSH